MSYFERYRAGEKRLAGKSAADRIAALRQLAAQAEREPRKDQILDAFRAATDLAQVEALRFPKNEGFQLVFAELSARLAELRAAS